MVSFLKIKKLKKKKAYDFKLHYFKFMRYLLLNLNLNLILSVKLGKFWEGSRSLWADTIIHFS